MYWFSGEQQKEKVHLDTKKKIYVTQNWISLYYLLKATGNSSKIAKTKLRLKNVRGKSFGVKGLNWNYILRNDVKIYKLSWF